MNDYKPPGLIKNIYFKHLTFGDAPIKIDNVWVEDEGEEHVMLEVLPRVHPPPLIGGGPCKAFSVPVQFLSIISSIMAKASGTFIHHLIAFLWASGYMAHQLQAG